MIQHSNNHQPDDPGTSSESFPEPLIFGRKSRHHVDSVIRTINRNAGKMTTAKIAEAVCLSVRNVERLARKHGIDLRCPVREKEPEPAGS